MKKLIFYAVFCLMFLAGGSLNYFGIIPYKMIFGALLPIILLPFVKIKNNSFFYSTLAFATIIAISAVVNKSDLLLTIWFFQNAIIPFLIYFVVVSYLREENIIKVYRWIVLIACIQLPIILIQRILYPVLNRVAAVAVSDYDIGFGTFYTSDDVALSFFVIGVLLFLLLDTKHNYFIKNRMAIVIWLTFTILIMNSKISYLILALIWGYYLIVKVRFKIIFFFFTVGVVVFVLAYTLGFREQIHANYVGLREQLTFNVDPEKAEIFFKTAQGNRPAALLYLASQPLKIVGEGPHALYNPITNQFNKGGDTSQLITFYVDIGALGLLISYVMIYSIMRGLQLSLFTRMYFVVLCIISAVSNIFLDGSIMMIFTIFCASALIPARTNQAVDQIGSK